MPMRTDALVIGGGVIGVSTAYYLARAGVAVTLVEKGGVAAGSSYGNAGLICPCHSVPICRPGVLTRGLAWMLDPESPFYIRPRLDTGLVAWLWRFRRHCSRAAVDRAIPLLRDMQRESLRLYREVVANEGLDCDFEAAGGLTVFSTPSGLDGGRREVETMARFGIPMELLPDPEAVREVEPAVGAEVVGGIRYPEDAHVDPARFVQGLADAARAAGAVLHTDTEVLGFAVEDDAIARVRTSGGDFVPRQVVLAAGAWSTPLARRLGLRIPMQPAKGYSITLPRPEGFLRTHVHMAEAKVIATPMGSRMRLAGTLELTGFDSSINTRRVGAIRRAARRHLTGLEATDREEEVWSGLRPCSPDGLPYLGRSPSRPNLVVATGHAMLGMSMGPVTGRLAAQIVSERTTSLDVTAFAPERFH